MSRKGSDRGFTVMAGIPYTVSKGHIIFTV
jgi:hypothetical protein